jgi:hypothetical protein
MRAAGLEPSVGDLIEMTHLVQWREAEARRMELARERWLEPRDLQEPTVN